MARIFIKFKWWKHTTLPTVYHHCTSYWNVWHFEMRVDKHPVLLRQIVCDDAR